MTPKPFLTCLLFPWFLNTSAQQITSNDSLQKKDNPPAIAVINHPIPKKQQPTAIMPVAEPGILFSPMIVTAIPYHGAFSSSNDDKPEFDLAPDNSGYHFSSNFLTTNLPLYTYDSSAVTFLAPNIYPVNAGDYQYRLLLNGKTTLIPWQNITNFADTNFGPDNFDKGMALLGTYKTTWNNSLVVELKRKDANDILTSATVYWKPATPVIKNIYLADELKSFLDRLKDPEHPRTKEDLEKWKNRYKPGELDSVTGLPKRLSLNDRQDNIIFYLQGNFHKKETLEYQLVKDGEIVSRWKPNSFDNNFIWLKNLKPGNYTLQMRFSFQKHLQSSFPFIIKSAWYQSDAFKISITTLAFLVLPLAFRLWKQQQTIKSEKIKNEKLDLGLRSLRAQLNPHFAYNALESIQDLIDKNEQQAATYYVVQFSRLLKGSLENMDSQYVALETELKMLENYIALEQLRFGFQYKISVDIGLNINNTEIPSLLLQPLIENAIKHGAGPKYENGLLGIRFMANNENMEIYITDNGKGFGKAGPDEGLGLRLVKERIRLLNSIFKEKLIRLSFNSNLQDSTTFQLTFKHWLA